MKLWMCQIRNLKYMDYECAKFTVGVTFSGWTIRAIVMLSAFYYIDRSKRNTVSLLHQPKSQQVKIHLKWPLICNYQRRKLNEMGFLLSICNLLSNTEEPRRSTSPFYLMRLFLFIWRWFFQELMDTVRLIKL